MTNPHSLGAEKTLHALMSDRIPAALVGPASRLLGLDRFERLYRDLRSVPGERPLPNKLLDRLDIRVVIAKEDLQKVPEQGPVVAVANHPFGLLDAATLAALLPERRSDVKFLGNQVLQAFPELRGRLIVVDPDDSARTAAVSVAGLRRALGLLRQGGMLAAFPAGEVSHWHLGSRRVEDRSWSPSIGGLIRRSGATAVPIYIEGSNSALFQLAGLLHQKLRTAMLPRELLNKKRYEVRVRIGAPIPADRLIPMATDAERSDYLRWRTYLLSRRQEFKARTSRPFMRLSRRLAKPEPIAAPPEAEAIGREIDRLPADARLIGGEMSCYLAPAEAIPTVLKEIGRLREISFRRAGEGTGRARDLDRFDAHYLHLFVWNRSKKEIVGAYRFAEVDEVRRRFGREGLYTATLFDYPDALLDAMGPSLELGRSFVRPEYQTSFAPLLTLWKGITKFVEQNPRYKTLFGPVSISASYQPVCRQLMASFLTRAFAAPGWATLVKPKRPLPAQETPHATLDLDELCQVLADVDAERPGLPVLLRQYLKLGGKLLGFNVDPEFSDALDGLIVVDLTKTDPKILRRYMGKAETERFLGFHRAKQD